MRLPLRCPDFCLTAFFILLASAACLQAQERLLPFQGQLTDPSGAVINPTAPLTLIFRLYETPVGGPVLWEETHPQVVVTAGRFSVLLGSRQPLPRPHTFSTTLFLGITIDDNDSATADIEMRPRQGIVPLIYANTAGDSEKLAGTDWSSLLVGGSNDPRNARIRADKIDPSLLDNLTRMITDLAQRVEALQLNSPPIGTIAAYAGPIDLSFEQQRGWLLCDGRSLDRNDPRYQALFAAIGTSWGADAGSSFKLPDLRGRFLRGVDKDIAGTPTPAEGGVLRDPDRDHRPASYPAGSVSQGNSGNNLGSNEGDTTKRPETPFTTNETGSHSHLAPTNNGQGGNSEMPREASGADFIFAASTNSAGNHTHTITGGGDAETRPKNVYVYWLIKYR